MISPSKFNISKLMNVTFISEDLDYIFLQVTIHSNLKFLWMQNINLETSRHHSSNLRLYAFNPFKVPTLIFSLQVFILYGYHFFLATNDFLVLTLHLQVISRFVVSQPC